eukprot:TRINITY_DN16094_c0_g1_i1.p1 TRINITY_DN16094_c0_g1~~TRINITY_DN16094_c0_g1_i1.p1  ORF type:complete len:273 (-),score=46.12 TRINITY_DN16094_c0_g1_i1:514-1296(-)
MVLGDAAREFSEARGLHFHERALLNPRRRTLLGLTVFDHCLFAAKRLQAKAVMQLHSVDTFLVPPLDVLKTVASNQRVPIQMLQSATANLLHRLDTPGPHCWIQLRSVNFGAAPGNWQQGSVDRMLVEMHTHRTDSFDPLRDVPIARPDNADYIEIHHVIVKRPFPVNATTPIKIDPWTDWRVNHYVDLHGSRCTANPKVPALLTEGKGSDGTCTVWDDSFVSIVKMLREHMEDVNSLAEDSCSSAARCAGTQVEASRST